MRRAMVWLDRNVGLVIVLGCLLVMSGMTWAATRNAPVEEALLKRLELSEGDHRAAISLSKGTEKPIVYSPEGRTLLDTSAWETRLLVDGEAHALYRDAYNAAADGDVAYVTWSAPGYQLEQRVETRGDGVTVQWSWLRKAGAPPQDVVLEVGQYAYHMQEASFDGRQIAYRLSAADPRSPPPFPVDPAPYAVRVHLDRTPDLLWFGETSEGIDGVHFRYNLSDPPEGRQVPVFTQRITYERGDVPLPTASGERRSVPALDPQASEVRLAAGDLRVSLPLFHGAHKPLLRDVDGRDLLEVSGWESTLEVDGERFPLYRQAYEVAHDDASATVTWRGEGHALEQRIRLTDASLSVEWSWLREEGAPRQDVTLEVAHFSRYMASPTADAGRLAWRLDGSDRVVDARFEPAPARLRVGETPEGIDSFRAAWTLADPPAGVRVPLANATFTLTRGDPPVLGPPVERIASPVEDREAGIILLGAGDLRALLATDRGAQQPVLRTADGRDLLEVSSRGSLLEYAGQPWRTLPLSAYDHRARIEDGRACVLYEEGVFAFRECVGLTQDNATVAWEWRRAPGGTEPDLRLTLAHFAFFMRDPTFDDGTLGYLLDPVDPREGPSEGPRHRIVARFDPAPDDAFFGGPPGSTDALRAVFRLEGDTGGEWRPVTTLEVTRSWE